jgi:hypothetical protein
MSQTTHRCRTCKAWIELTPEQNRQFHTAARIELKCPHCHVAQKFELVPSGTAPKIEAAAAPIPTIMPAAPWGGAVAAPVIEAAPLAPPKVTPAAIPSTPTAHFDPMARYRTATSEPPDAPADGSTSPEQKSLSDRFDALPKIVQYAALFVPMIVIGIIVLSFMSGDSRPPATP